MLAIRVFLAVGACARGRHNRTTVNADIGIIESERARHLRMPQIGVIRGLSDIGDHAGITVPIRTVENPLVKQRRKIHEFARVLAVPHLRLHR